MILALAFAAVMNFVSYFFSDKIALAMYRAQPVTREATAARLRYGRAADAEDRHSDAEDLCDSRRNRPTRLPRDAIRSHASVAVTHGILGLLNDEELEGVLAHELGHVQQPRHPDQFGRRDHRRRDHDARQHGTLGHDLRRLWADGDRDDRGGGGIAALFMLILAPIAATLIQLAVSRSREYQADATGAHFTGNPYALASALQKLDAYSRAHADAGHAIDRASVHHPAAAGGMNFGNLFSTHPPIAKRIERLTGRPAEFTQ